MTKKPANSGKAWTDKDVAQLKICPLAIHRRGLSH